MAVCPRTRVLGGAHRGWGRRCGSRYALRRGRLAVGTRQADGQRTSHCFACAESITRDFWGASVAPLSPERAFLAAGSLMLLWGRCRGTFPFWPVFGLGVGGRRERPTFRTFQEQNHKVLMFFKIHAAQVTTRPNLPPAHQHGDHPAAAAALGTGPPPA